MTRMEPHRVALPVAVVLLTLGLQGVVAQGEMSGGADPASWQAEGTAAWIVTFSVARGEIGRVSWHTWEESDGGGTAILEAVMVDGERVRSHVTRAWSNQPDVVAVDGPVPLRVNATFSTSTAAEVWRSQAIPSGAQEVALVLAGTSTRWGADVQIQGAEPGSIHTRQPEVTVRTLTEIHGQLSAWVYLGPFVTLEAREDVETGAATLGFWRLPSRLVAASASCTDPMGDHCLLDADGIFEGPAGRWRGSIEYAIGVDVADVPVLIVVETGVPT